MNKLRFGIVGVPDEYTWICGLCGTLMCLHPYFDYYCPRGCHGGTPWLNTWEADKGF